MSRPTKAARLRELLESSRCWHSNRELAEVGGIRFGARLEELRSGWDGYRPLAIEVRAANPEAGLFQYRCTGFAGDHPLPRHMGTLRQKYLRLRAENLHLRAMLEGAP